jgi:hypothetical protein
LYPSTLAEAPDRPSPGRLADGTEVVVVQLKDGTHTVVPVTVENADRTIAYGRSRIGKGRQLEVDANDFPTLARTGRHSPAELATTKTITGRPVDAITCLARPGNASGAGFLAADEDLLAVLHGDNVLVQRLGLTHPELARPLFHVWNLVLAEYERNRFGRNWDNVTCLFYRGKRIRFGQVHPTRGFQESIFDDEIQGAFEINLHRELSEGEEAFLRERYAHLNDEQRSDLAARLSRIHTSEMEPYYIMRYGFYEGHTPYRVDPLTIAFVFGLRSLEDLEAALPGGLYATLTTHYRHDFNGQAGR